MPRYTEESQMKILNISVRYSRMWFLSDSPEKISLTAEQIEEIYNIVEQSGLQISFDGWKFDSDITYRLNFALLSGGSYYCFSMTPDNIISQFLEDDYEKCIRNYNKDAFNKDNYWNGTEGFNTPSWKFTTYHDSCWRDGAYQEITSYDSKITSFMHKLGVKYQIPDLIKFNTPNFTKIENMKVYPLVRWMRGYDGLYSKKIRHFFYKGKDETVYWIDLSSTEFKNHVTEFMKNKEGFANGDFIFSNPTSCELAVKNELNQVYIFSMAELESLIPLAYDSN